METWSCGSFRAGVKRQQYRMDSRLGGLNVVKTKICLAEKQKLNTRICFVVRRIVSISATVIYYYCFFSYDGARHTVRALKYHTFLILSPRLRKKRD
jgi:hypothetical protein